MAVYTEVSDAALAAFLAGGVLDVLIQRWLFLRDMKMSATELKREFKEQEGDPHVKGAHRRQRHRTQPEHNTPALRQLLPQRRRRFRRFRRRTRFGAVR